MRSFILSQLEKGFQNRRVFKEFWCSGVVTARAVPCIDNKLRKIELNGRKIKKQRVVIVKSRVNQTGSNYNSCIVINTTPEEHRADRTGKIEEIEYC
jgi:hypothetical protein